MGPKKTPFPCGARDGLVSHNEPHIICDSCKHFFHKKCSGLDENDFEYAVSNKAATWKCYFCSTSSSQTPATPSGSRPSGLSQSQPGMASFSNPGPLQSLNVPPPDVAAPNRLLTPLAPAGFTYFSPSPQNLYEQITDISAQHMISSQNAISSQGSVSSQVDPFNRMTTALLNELQTFKTDFMSQLGRMENRFINEFAALSGRVRLLEQDHATRIKTCEDALLELSSNLHASKHVETANIGMIRNELEDRRIRSHNVMLYGVSEQGSASDNADEFSPALDKSVNVDAANVDFANADSSGDTLFVKTLLSKLNPTPKSTFRAVRMGKKSQERVRPLKVIFEDNTEALRVLKSRKLLSTENKIAITADRTDAQRNELKQLLNEMDRRTKSGETNLTLKYKLGEPYIDGPKNLRNLVVD